MDETGSKVQFEGDDSYYLIYLLKREDGRIDNFLQIRLMNVSYICSKNGIKN